MKKTLSILLTLVLLLSLFGCSLPEGFEIPGLEDLFGNSDNEDNTGDTSEDENEEESDVNYINVSIADAIMMAQSVGEELSSLDLCISGTVASVSNPEFGNMKITDGKDTISVYGLYDKNQVPYKELTDKPVKGDEITIYGKVHTFNGEAEFKDAIIVSFKHVKAELDDSYAEVTIAEAREAEVGEKLIIEGVVARITYADKMIPNGFYVVDSTGSIYVYGEDAHSVKIGNTVKLGGIKDYYVLENEKGFAEKYGYRGSCQLRDLVLLENNATNAEFDKNWITDSTVKDIIETPITENITTNIYRVNALVKKVPGSGFVNYYFYDIDDKTSSYTYTSNGGDDFTWLDEFDGKICTVYLSPINCKSTASGCFYRFIPILVIDENYTFDLNSAADYAIKYEVFDQFKTEYSSDPALEVVTTVSSELLGFEGVSVTYTSSNSSIASFVVENDKTIFHTNGVGVATITMTASYNGKTSAKSILINVNAQQTFDTISIADALNAADGELVIIKGIVVSSLVNQTGFYISDETGIVAVTCSSAALEEISLGNEIVIQGERYHKKKNDTATNIGQSVIRDAEVLANYYGSHEYNLAHFDTTKTLADLYSFDINEDYTTQGYVVTCIVNFVKEQHYTKCSLQSVDGSITFDLYCSSAAQYGWLEQYAGKEVTMELMVCNWNSAKYYKGCVVSVTYNGVKTLNNLNFEN